MRQRLLGDSSDSFRGVRRLKTRKEYISHDWPRKGFLVSWLDVFHSILSHGSTRV